MSKIMTEKNKIKLISKRSFLDLYGSIKVKKRMNIRKIKRQFEKAMAEKVAL